MRSMLKITCVLLSLAFTFCKAGDYERREQSNLNNAKILQYDFDNTGTGPYRFSFATSDGIERKEEGNLINPETEDEALIVTGSYSYIGPDGVTYAVRYTADQNGFHPEGDHIKVPPFVPWNKHQHNHDADHSGHYNRGGVVQRPNNVPIFLPVTQRPIYPSSSSVFLQSNVVQKPLLPQFIPVNPRPSFTQVVSSTVKPQTFNPFREQPTLLTYLPTRRDLSSNEENASYQSTNVANSILEILGDSENVEKEDKKKVKVEEINSL